MNWSACTFLGYSDLLHEESDLGHFLLGGLCFSYRFAEVLCIFWVQVLNWMGPSQVSSGGEAEEELPVEKPCVEGLPAEVGVGAICAAWRGTCATVGPQPRPEGVGWGVERGWRRV